MRKRILIAVLLVLLVSGSALAAGATFNGYPVVNVAVNGRPVQGEVPAIVMDGRTLLPVRSVAEMMGAVVQWDAAANTVYLVAPDVAALQADNNRLQAEIVRLEGQVRDAEAKLAASAQVSEPAVPAGPQWVAYVPGDPVPPILGGLPANVTPAYPVLVIVPHFCVPEGQAVELRARYVDANGYDIGAGPNRLVWAVSGGGIENHGTFLGNRVGQYTVTLSWEGFSAAGTLEVREGPCE